MSLYDFFQRMTNDPNQQSAPVNAQTPTTTEIAAPTMQQAQQQDYQNAALQRMGQMGWLMMAAGQRMTPKERATIMAQAPQYLAGIQGDVQNAAQTRLLNMRGQAAQDEMGRQQALTEKLKDPGFLQKIGISPEIAQAIGIDGIQKLIENQALANTPENLLDRRYKEAQINNLNRPDKVTPQMVDLPGGGKGWTIPGSTEITPITGAGKGSSEEPKKTEAEAKNYQFAQQSIDAYHKLADPEYQYALTSRTQEMANKLPFFSSPWSSDDYRSGEAASSSMTDAILRNKSGATIHDPEIQDEIRRVIPQPGDTQEQLRDKVNRQRLMIDGFIGAANPADRKALREQFDQANKSLMDKYQQNTLPKGVNSIRQIQ